MSSDCFYVRVGRIEGTTVVFHCLTGFAGGYDDCFTGRSFALYLLIDAKGRASDSRYLPTDTPADDATRLKAIADAVESASAPLLDLFPDPQPWDGAWHAKVAPQVVLKTKLLERFNALGDDALSARRREIEPLEAQGGWVFMKAAWERLHHFDLEVQVTDAKYLAHLRSGLEFGTTAFEAWSEP
jgi:hypothetical protein